jgi:signal transduction histidine kinase
MSKAPVDETIDTLNDIVQSVSYAVEAGTLREVLARIAEAGRQLVGASYAAIGVPDGEGGLRYFETAGISPEQIAAMPHQPEGRGLLGAIMRERHAMRLKNMTDDPRSVGFPEGHPEMRTFLGVPIKIGAQLLGMLYMSDRNDGEPFDERDQRLAETLAGYAALAIAGAQLNEQQQRLVLLEERDRIAMSLHDSIIQDLYAIGMHIDLVRRQNDDLDTDFQPVLQSLNRVIDDIRAYILDLRAMSYQQQTVRACLEDMVSRLHIHGDMSVIIDAPDQQPPISAITFEAVCQITHEALSNAVRHAQPDHIKVSAGRDDSWFVVRIVDDGTGFDIKDETLRTGMGLRNIRQRARLHGGEVLLDSASNQGTTVTVRVPALPKLESELM